MDSIPSPSPSEKIQIICGKVYLRQNIAGGCQQPFCFQKFVDISQQCFALLPQGNFLQIIWIFTEGEGDGIESMLSS